jgi:hypothetical protein
MERNPSHPEQDDRRLHMATPICTGARTRKYPGTVKVHIELATARVALRNTSLTEWRSGSEM